VADSHGGISFRTSAQGEGICCNCARLAYPVLKYAATSAPDREATSTGLLCLPCATELLQELADAIDRSHGKPVYGWTGADD
jgi:hypothetical protein